jgi:hypothetical protein
MANDRETLVLDIHIDAETLLEMYRGKVQSVLAYSRDGRRVRLPILALRGFVAHDGINGTFAVTMDAARRLQDIRRLA